MADLRKRGIASKVRTLKTGETVGGIPFTRGPLAHLLRNRFYIGEVAFKGEILKGEQTAIVDRALFDAVQAKLNEQNNNHKTTRMKSEALLAGRIFDDRGNRMSPSHARKRGIKYRYYLSSALLDGRPTKAGSIPRVPAVEIETLVVKAVREHLKLTEPTDDDAHHQAPCGPRRGPGGSTRHHTCLDTNIKRRRAGSNKVLHVPGKSHLRSGDVRFCCRPSVFTQPERSSHPIRNPRNTGGFDRARAGLARRTDRRSPMPRQKASPRESDCSPRKINKMISLAFLAPDLVKAAIEGKLPHGMGVMRLFDLPAEWSRQREMLGLAALATFI